MTTLPLARVSGWAPAALTGLVVVRVTALGAAEPTGGAQPVIAAMIEGGLATTFDERACVTLPEWKDDPRKRAITLRQLLEP